jgi:hypothetical protein
VPPTNAVHPPAVEFNSTLVVTSGKNTKNPLTTQTADPKVNNCCQQLNNGRGDTNATHQDIFHHSNLRIVEICLLLLCSVGCNPFL